MKNGQRLRSAHAAQIKLNDFNDCQAEQVFSLHSWTVWKLRIVLEFTLSRRLTYLQFL